MFEEQSQPPCLAYQKDRQNQDQCWLVDHVMHRKCGLIVVLDTKTDGCWLTIYHQVTWNTVFSLDGLDKISNIRSKLDEDTTNNINTCTVSLADPQTFNNVTAVTEENIIKTVQKSNSKSCGLDPNPTLIIKQLIEPLSPYLTKIVNLSLRDGVVPRTLKSATVTALIK